MDCLFCKFAMKEIPLEFLYESENIFAINDIEPQAPTHVLLIPKRHFENAPELAAAESETIAEIFKVAKKISEERGLDSFRTVFNTGSGAGQSVFHAHLHLLGGRKFAWPPG
jgi:histidine triad (HIT) family protein